MARAKTIILLIGLAVLAYVVKDTFAPIPAAPFRWDALAAGITLVLGVSLPFAYPPLRRGIANSPLLKAGITALLGTESDDPFGDLCDHYTDQPPSTRRC